MLAVKLNLVTFHGGTSTETLHSASSCPAIQLLVETDSKDVHRRNLC